MSNRILGDSRRPAAALLAASVIVAFVFIPATVLGRVGDYSGHEITPVGLRVEAGGDTVLFTFYTPDVVRLDFLPLGSPAPDTGFVVIRHPDPGVEFEVRDTDASIEVLTSELVIHMDKTPLRISYFDALGWELLAEPEGGGLEAVDNLSRARFVLPHDLHLYGTGERGIGIDLRGHSFGMYNTQVYGYGGPVETMKINVPFLATSRGYALYFDTSLPGGFDLGRTDTGLFHYEQNSDGLSYFLFAAPTVAGQLERYTWLTGRQPMPPKWALGYLQSKYGYRTRGEAETMVRTMRARGIPADALILDLYWFEHMGDLSWDIKAFPNPPGMIADFLDLGFKTILISQPYFNEYSSPYHKLTTTYRDLVGRNWLDEAYILDNWWSCGCDAVLLDVTNPDARTWLWDRYEGFLHAGVAGLWTDLGEPERHPWDMDHHAGSTEEVHNVYNLLWAKTIFDGFSAYRPDERLFNLTRSGYAGIQRYGVFTWSGDVSRSFGGLAVQVPIMLNVSLSGLGYHSSDLGGFTGWTSPELYVRWMQFGAFNPVMRAHGVDNQGTEPWARGIEAEEIATEFIRLRYRLLPYLYSLAWENHRTGIPMTRPLFFHDPDDASLSGLSDVFLFGPDILVAPVTEAGITEREVYLPRGHWVDFWTDSLHTGPGSVLAAAPLDRIPLFVRTGALLPIQPAMNYVDEMPLDTLSLHVYPPAGSRREAFTLYEDDGLSRDYETGGYATTLFTQEVLYSDTDTTLHLEIGGAEGGFTDIPETRTILTIVHLTGKPPGLVRRDSLALLPSPTEDVLMAGGEGYFYDEDARLLLIKFEHFSYRSSAIEVGGWQPVGTGGEDGGSRRIWLGRNRPNPFSGGTTIPYTIARVGQVTLEVFSPLGKKVATLVDDTVNPGEHSAVWNGRDLFGRRSAPGVYFCRLASAGGTETGKIVLIR